MIKFIELLKAHPYLWAFIISPDTSILPLEWNNINEVRNVSLSDEINFDKIFIQMFADSIGNVNGILMGFYSKDAYLWDNASEYFGKPLKADREIFIEEKRYGGVIQYYAAYPELERPFELYFYYQADQDEYIISLSWNLQTPVGEYYKIIEAKDRAFDPGFEGPIIILSSPWSQSLPTDTTGWKKGPGNVRLRDTVIKVKNYNKSGENGN